MGVARQSGRGVPDCIKQETVTRKDELESVRGTLNVAELVGDPSINLVAISLYDSKPVYLMSSACDQVCWRRKELKIWDKDERRLVNAPFHRVNIVDDYNKFMGNVDIADQLRGSYRFDHWMRKRKWWWSMFFWNFQVLLTNAYILYKKYHCIHDLKPISHYEFR